MVVDPAIASIPPLQGCLYCHGEGTTALYPSRKILGIGSDFPLIKCSRCGVSAELDADPALPDAWHIRYRRVNHDPRYYYVALHFGGAGWLPAHEALAISTAGYVQRQRVAQAQTGDLSWLETERAQTAGESPGHSSQEPQPYLSLVAVTLHETTGTSMFGLGGSDAVLDSGKLFVTQDYLYLDGQRRVWKIPFEHVGRVDYSNSAWIVYLDDGEQRQYLRGANAEDQMDAQLAAAVVEALWRKYLSAIPSSSS